MNLKSFNGVNNSARFIFIADTVSLVVVQD